MVRRAVGRAVDAVDRAGAAIGADRSAAEGRPDARKRSVARRRPVRSAGAWRRQLRSVRRHLAAVVAPVNAHGQVAFYATVLRAPGREGIFLTEAGRITKVAAFGDALPGGGTIAGFAADPLPSLNAAGHVAFVAHVAGGRTTEGVFLAGDNGLQVIALAGDDAPGVPAGVLIGFDAPALNDNDELAFVANVRRGRDTLDVLYFWNGRRLQRLVAEGELLLRLGGTMDKIGEPALNNAGVVAFPAAILKGPVLGGIFVAGARNLRLLVGAGERRRVARWSSASPSGWRSTTRMRLPSAPILAATAAHARQCCGPGPRGWSRSLWKGPPRLGAVATRGSGRGRRRDRAG